MTFAPQNAEEGNMASIFDKPCRLADAEPKDVKGDKGSVSLMDLECITTPDILASLAAKISYHLKTVATIVWEDESGVSARTDKFGVAYEMRPSCRLLRHYCEKKRENEAPEFKSKNDEETYNRAHPTPCEASDRYYISYLKKELKKHNRIVNDISLTENVFPKFVENGKLRYDERDYFGANYYDGDYPYLEYQCPIMGYTEVLFPIIIEQKYLGAVLVGQIKRTDSDVVAKGNNIYEDFISNNGDLYECDSPSEPGRPFSLRRQTSQVSKKAVLDSVRNYENGINSAQENTNSDDLLYLMAHGIKPYDEKEYREFIVRCNERIKKLIGDIELLLRDKRGEYIESALSTVNKNAEIELCKLDESKPDETNVSQYSDILQHMIYDKLKKFEITAIRIFGDQKRPGIYSKKMEIIFNTQEREGKEEILFDYERLDDKYKPMHPWEPNYSFKDDCNGEFVEAIFENLRPSGINKNNQMLILYPSWLVMIEVKSLESHQEVYKIFMKPFVELIKSFLSRYSLRLSTYVANKYEATLRIYRHECVHIANAIASRNDNDLRRFISAVSEYKKTRSNHLIMNIEDKNLNATCDDIDSNVRLIKHMVDTIGIITGRTNRDNIRRACEIKDFRVLRDIVIKWEAALKFDLRLREKNMRICHDKDIDDEVIRNYWGLLDLVIYNLMDNAVKYGYWGTNVNVIIGAHANNQSANFTFVVENYGSEIEPDPKAYGMYYRGKKGDEQTHVEGDGLGLYIIKEISDMLSLEVKYTCEWLSNYNIGLIDKYIDIGENDGIKDKLLNEKYRILEHEIGDLERKEYINRNAQIPISSMDISLAYLETFISKPTYRVRFEITISRDVLSKVSSNTLSTNRI
jgi:signal transduction histidine kinase